MKAINYLITMAKTKRIIKTLKDKYNFDISGDLDTITTVIDMVYLRDLSNSQVVKEILEIHTITMEEIRAS